MRRPLSTVALACTALAALLGAACTGPGTSLGPGAGESNALLGGAPRPGQPTARDLAFLLGAWQQEDNGARTDWEVWTRNARGLEGTAWQASRGVSRRTERLEVVLTLEGWVLTSVLFDDFDREYRSEPFELVAWGDGWVRFECNHAVGPHAIAYRVTEVGLLEAAVVSRSANGSEETRVWRSRTMPD